MSYAIEAESLSKTYKTEKKKICGLNELNLNVKEGDVFGFIGPNGAGKTTAIKIFMGLIKPSSGQVKIFGNPAGSVAAKLKTGYLSEISYYYNFMEADTMLRYFGTLRGLSGQTVKKRIDECLELVGLAERRKDKLKSYSKGMLQRFGIALALLSDPPLLILDEPTSGLDPIGRKEIKDIIKILKKKGTTIFLSSHHLSEVEKICDIIGIINRGKMLECKPLNQFMEHDKKVYTIRFTEKEHTVRNRIREMKYAMSEDEDGVINATVPEENFTEMFRFLTENGGAVQEIIPGFGSLEEIFFNLITGRSTAQ